MKKYIYSLSAVFTCLLLAWSTGFDFNERGAPLFFILYVTLAFGGITYAFTAIAEEA